MGHRLVVAGGKIQIDIRHFVSVKSQENGKRDIVSVLI